MAAKGVSVEGVRFRFRLPCRRASGKHDSEPPEAEKHPNQRRSLKVLANEVGDRVQRAVVPFFGRSAEKSPRKEGGMRHWTIARRVILAFAVILCLFTPTWAKSPSIQAKPPIYGSPDGAVSAKIVWVPVPREEGFESRLVILSRSSKPICRADFTSPDHEHGYVVEKAAWSPDSQFFVATLSNSGGHSPWYVLAMVYRRRQNRFESLGDFIGSVASPRFSFKPPDALTVKVWKRAPDGAVDFTNNGVPRTVDLSQVFQKGPRRNGEGPWFP